MFEGHDQAIFDLLAERQLVAPAALRGAYADHQATGKPLARMLVDLGLVEPAALFQAVAGQLGCDGVAELPAALPDRAVGLIAGELARTYGIAPLAGDGVAVTVVAVDPFNPQLVTDLAFALEREVKVMVGDPERVRALIRQHYGEEASVDMVLGELEAQAGLAPAGGALTENDIEQLAGLTPIVRFVNVVLAQAIRERASDVHFEPFERTFRIRYRIDGTLRDMSPPPRSLALPIISRVKVLANLNIAERRLPQDGRVRLTLAGRAVDLRVSTLPTQFGESVVLRVLDQSSVRLELGDLGLPDGIRRGLKEAVHRPNGMVLVTGPTGSGKTTTLYSCLKVLNLVGAKLLTVEDPVEYEIDGIMQVPVNPAAGLTFARALRTFLRQDPDVVMVGEIRDLETAQVAIQAALTGHLVLSTLHTNDAPSAVTRLMDMGVEPFLLASTIEAVLAQRLLRRICRACRAPYDPGGGLLRQLGAEPSALAGKAFFRGAGCAACQGTGYRGRVGLYEFLRMTDPMRELIARAPSLIELREQAIAEGLVPLRAAGVNALLAGETTVEEVMRYV
ncbi:MAG TPA: ATPase, T2SS/T4P/T4SS family [Lacunisphaera sp.]|nr:ATPase, T2SS/T4P/T4SS family [Lacunisphaera sp.]